ncbi:hypothetical protein ACVNF4_08375 [Streptomyces sp. S6]
MSGGCGKSAAHLASVLMAAFTGELSLESRFVCLDLLGGLVFNDGEYSEKRCQEIARQGLWLLYRDLWSVLCLALSPMPSTC